VKIWLQAWTGKPSRPGTEGLEMVSWTLAVIMGLRARTPASQLRGGEQGREEWKPGKRREAEMWETYWYWNGE
jgi:hypothetical protein